MAGHDRQKTPLKTLPPIAETTQEGMEPSTNVGWDARSQYIPNELNTATHNSPESVRNTQRRRTHRKKEDVANDFLQVQRWVNIAKLHVQFITVFAMYFFPLVIYHCKKGSNEVQELPNYTDPWNNFDTICIYICIALVYLATIHWLNRYETDNEPRKKRPRQTEEERDRSEADDVRQVNRNAMIANVCVLVITIFAMYFFPCQVYHYKNGSNDKNHKKFRFLPVQEIPNDKNPWNFEWNFESICISIMIAVKNFATIQRISLYYYWERTFMMISMVVLYYMVLFFVLNDRLIDDYIKKISFFVILVSRCYLNSRDVKLVDIASLE